jgi:hypothetical protein
MDFISVFAHSFFSSVSAKTTCQASAGFNLFSFFIVEHFHSRAISAHSGKHRFTSPFHSRMVGHAQAIWHGSSMDCLPSHSLAGFVPKRAKWRCGRLENGNHRSKHRFFSRRCQRKLRHRTSQRQFLSSRPEPFWRIWWRQLSSLIAANQRCLAPVMRP